MPKRKADSDEEASASYSEEEQPKPSKKAKPSETTKAKQKEKKEKAPSSSKAKTKGDKAQEEDANDPAQSVDISSRRRLSLSKFKGNTFIDIRELYTKDGEVKLGKKGITLKLEEWKELIKHANTVEEWFKEE